MSSLARHDVIPGLAPAPARQQHPQNETPIQSQRLHQHGTSTGKMKAPPAPAQQQHQQNETPIQSQHLHLHQHWQNKTPTQNQHQHGSSTRKTKTPIQSHTIEKLEPL